MRIHTWRSIKRFHVQSKKNIWQDVGSTHGAGVGLNVDTPLCRVQVERLEGPLPAEDLEFIDILVTTIVTGIGETLRVFVGEDGAVGLHSGPASQVLWEERMSRGDRRRSGVKRRTSEAMSSRPVNCLHVSLSMMFLTSGSISARGA